MALHRVPRRVVRGVVGIDGACPCGLCLRWSGSARSPVRAPRESSRSGALAQAAEPAGVAHEQRVPGMRGRAGRQNRSSPPGIASSVPRSVSLAARRRSPPTSDRADRGRGSGRARPRRRGADRAAWPAPHGCARCPAAPAPARCRRRCAPWPTRIRSVRSSDVAISRGTSVSSARSNAGSTSASSGNSRSSDRQNASMVLMAMSPSRSRSSSQRRRSSSERSRRHPQLANDPLAHLGGRLAGEGDREDVRRDRCPARSRFT